jgi:hypothetical protein
MKIYSPEIIGDTSLTGALDVTGGITGSLFGTASYADFALSASYAPDTTFPFTGSAGISGSIILNGNETISGSLLLGASSFRNQINIQNANGTANTVSADGNSNDIIIIGAGNTVGKGQDIAIGTLGNTGIHANGQGNVVIGRSNTMSNGNQKSANFIIGYNNTLNHDGSYRMILGHSHQSSGTSSYSGIFAGDNNTITHERSVIIGGQNITSTANDTVFVPNFNASGSAVVTGSVTITGTQYHINANNVTGDPGNGVNAINIGSGGSTVNASAKNAAIAGGSSNALGSSAYQAFVGGGANNTVNQLRTAIVGGFGNSVTCPDATIIGAASSTLQNGNFGFYSGIFAGTNNIIDGSSVQNSAIIGGLNNRVSNVSSSVVIGGSFITASVANTVYVPNLNVSGSLTVSQNTVFSGSVRGEVALLSITSNTASLNCASDNFFTLQLVSGSNTFINPSNIQPGQTINIRVNTTGSATVSFPASVLQPSGSTYVPTTTTGVDILTFISFDSTSLYLANIKNLV